MYKHNMLYYNEHRHIAITRCGIRMLSDYEISRTNYER